MASHFCIVPQGVGLGLMTFAFKYLDEDTENNGNGQKSMVKAFLSLEVWQPLGKLTYVMYLVHLIVYAWWAGDSENPSYYSEWDELLLVIGIWIIVASLGLVLWFVVEKPLNNMVTLFMSLLTGKGGRRSKQMMEPPLLSQVDVDEDIKRFVVEQESEDRTAEQRNSINSSNIIGVDRELEGQGFHSNSGKYN